MSADNMTATPSQARVLELEEAIREVVTQEMDDICWMDIYVRLAKLVGIDFYPKLLPKEKFKKNCDRFTESVYVGCPYAVDKGTQAIKEAEDLRMLFELRWKADLRAIERWRKAGPGRELAMPDHTDMVVFLLEELDKAQAKYDELHDRHHPNEEIS